MSSERCISGSPVTSSVIGFFGGLEAAGVGIAGMWSVRGPHEEKGDNRERIGNGRWTMGGNVGGEKNGLTGIRGDKSVRWPGG